MKIGYAYKSGDGVSLTVDEERANIILKAVKQETAKLLEDDNYVEAMDFMYRVNSLSAAIKELKGEETDGTDDNK